MIELLQREPWDVSSLGDELAVTNRTVYRYLEVIERAGALKLRRMGRLRHNAQGDDPSYRVYYYIERLPSHYEDSTTR